MAHFKLLLSLQKILTKSLKNYPKLLLFFLLIIIPSALFALPSIFQIPSQDLSMSILRSIFGSMGTLLLPSNTNITAGMLAASDKKIPLEIALSYFNNAVLLLGGIVVLYTIIVSTINTAHDGEMLGKKWNSIWIPVRTALGFALLLPSKAGYTIIQMIVMWFIVQGVGAADYIWKNTLATLYGAPQPTPDVSSSIVGTFAAANIIFTNAVCQQALGQTLLNTPIISASPGFSTSTTFIPAVQSSTTQSTSAIPFVSPGQCVVKFGIEGPGLPDEYYICGTAKIALPPTAKGNPAACASSFNNPNQQGTNQYYDPCKNQGSFQATNSQYPSASYKPSPFYSFIANLQNIANAFACDYKNGTINDTPQNNTPSPVQEIQTDIQNATKEYLKSVATEVYNAYKNAEPYNPPESASNPDSSYTYDNYPLLSRGWAIAGSFFIAKNQLTFSSSAGYVLPGVTPPMIGQIINWGNSNANQYEKGFTPQNALSYIESGISSTCLGSGAKALARGTGADENCSITKILAAIEQQKKNWNEGNIPVMDVNSPSSSLLTGNSSLPHYSIKIAPIGDLTATPIGTTLIHWLMEGVGYVFTGIIDIIQGESYTGPLFSSIIKTFGAGTQYNPVFNLMHWGYNTLNSISDLVGVFMLSIFILGLFTNLSDCVNPIGFAISNVLILVLPLITFVIGLLWTYGAIFAYYVPMLPYIIYTVGVIAWILFVIEAMVAAPIIALGILHPEGRHDIFGNAGAGLMILVNVFLRPSLMVIGFIASFALVSATIELINIGFNYSVYNIALSTAGGTETSSGTHVGYVTLFGALTFMGLYVMLILTAVNKSFSLIYVLPDKILRWISGAPEESGVQQELHSVKQGFDKLSQQAQQTGEQLPQETKGTAQAYRQAKSEKRQGEEKKAGEKKDIEI